MSVYIFDVATNTDKLVFKPFVIKIRDTNF